MMIPTKSMFLIAQLLFLGQISFAQKGSIAGLIHNEFDEGLAFSNVTLTHKNDSTIIRGATTDDQGKFLIPDLSAGSYVFNVSFLGYDPYYTDVQIIDSKNILLKPIALSPSDHLLEGLEIVGQKALFIQKSDRLIVNVSGLPTFQGNSALQVLQKAPGVLVQEHANSISLNNKGEVLVMINDRISRIPTSALLNQLKGMQAENIDRIEIIHQPSAKYDSNNSSGIIHIILKKNEAYGLSGNTSGTIGMGQRPKANGSLDLNFRNPKLNIYGNLSGFQNRSPFNSVNHYREYAYQGDQYYYENKLEFTNPRTNSVGVTVGSDFEIDEKRIVGMMVGYTNGNFAGDNFTSFSRGFINDSLNTNSQFLLDTNNPTINTFANLNYSWQFSKKSSINLDFDRVYLGVKNSSELLYEELSNDVEKTTAFRESKFLIYTAKVDYEYKTNSADKILVGIKGTFNNSSTDAKLRSKIASEWYDSESFFMNDAISEQILAAYFSAEKKWNNKLKSNIGARLEHYDYQLMAANIDDDFTNSYTNIFPVLRSTYTIDDFQTLTLSFNRRIERPGFKDQAGYFALIDPTLFVFSNTRIRPAFTNAVRLAYNRGSIIASFEANQTLGAIAFYNTVDKEKGLQTSVPTNFDKMSGYLLSLGFPILLGEHLKMNWNIDASYKRVEDSSNRPLPFKKGILGFSAQLTNVVDLGKAWTLNIDGRYMSSFLAGDQILYLQPYLNLGISKKFKNQNKLTFSIQDLTATSGAINWEYDQPELSIRTFGDNNSSERVFQLTFSAPFGNLKVKEKRERATGSQEERDRM